MRQYLPRAATWLGVAFSFAALALLATTGPARAAPVGPGGAEARTAQQESAARVIGVVIDEHGQVLQVRTRSGEVDVHWTPDTVCAVNGERAECDAVAPGMLIGAHGTFSGGSSQFQADGIRARARMPHRIAGVVRSESGQSLSVERRDGTLVEVAWTGDTRCRTREGEFDCERLAPGDRVVAFGRFEQGTFHARVIGLLAPDSGRTPLRARVSDRATPELDVVHE